MTLFASIQAPAAPQPAPAQPATAQAVRPAAAAPTRDAAAWRVAEDFESFFIGQMLEIQTSTIPTDGPFGGGQAERIFRSMQNGEHAKAITQRGGLGIAENVYREIIALQEASRR